MKKLLKQLSGWAAKKLSFKTLNNEIPSTNRRGKNFLMNVSEFRNLGEVLS